jgi:hypothetical protein
VVAPSHSKPRGLPVAIAGRPRSLVVRGSSLQSGRAVSPEGAPERKPANATTSDTATIPSDATNHRNPETAPGSLIHRGEGSTAQWAVVAKRATEGIAFTRERWDPAMVKRQGAFPMSEPAGEANQRVPLGRAPPIEAALARLQAAKASSNGAGDVSQRRGTRELRELVQCILEQVFARGTQAPASLLP